MLPDAWHVSRIGSIGAADAVNSLEMWYSHQEHPVLILAIREQNWDDHFVVLSVDQLTNRCNSFGFVERTMMAFCTQIQYLTHISETE